MRSVQLLESHGRHARDNSIVGFVLGVGKSREGNLSNVLRDLKEHTAKKIIQEVGENRQESRREWLLQKFTLKEHDDGRKQYRVWQPGNHPVELYSDWFINQKENYIHMNPVEAGMVSRPEHYRLSSASEESPIKVRPLR